LGGGIRLDLAQYRELAAFAAFASDLDPATKAQLERGKRVTDLMKQKQYSPLSIGEMGASLYAANEGFMDDVEVEKIVAFEAAMHSYLNSNEKELMDTINASGAWDKDIEAKLRSAIESFKANGVW